MLHPTKNEDGVIEDFETSAGVIHFITIGWELLFACVPPPHYKNGWVAFFASLGMIAGVTYLVE